MVIECLLVSVWQITSRRRRQSRQREIRDSEIITTNHCVKNLSLGKEFRCNSGVVLLIRHNAQIKYYTLWVLFIMGFAIMALIRDQDVQGEEEGVYGGDYSRAVLLRLKEQTR